MKTTIFGTGYVGLSNTMLLAQHNEAVAIDIVPAKVHMLTRMQSSIEHAEIEGQLAKTLNFRTMLNKQDAYQGADFVFMPLPADDPLQRQPNISRDRECLNDVQPQVQLEQCLQKTICYFGQLPADAESTPPQ